ncbi:MAG: alanine racemase [Acidimicrobiales bacterium]
MTTHRADSAPTLHALSTPALLVDLDRLERNLTLGQAVMDEARVAFRPHVKTHKVPDLAFRQLKAGACGIAVAKTSEAELFAAAGCTDVAVAYPVVGEDKWRRLARLSRSVEVTVNVESEAAVLGLGAAAAGEGGTLHVQIEVDSGLGRSGIPVGDLRAVEALARLIEKTPGLIFDGITTHRGVSFAGAAEIGAEEAGRAEASMLVSLAGALEGSGLACRQVTAGSTATCRGVASVEGVTEVRAGAYLFNGGAQLDWGVATLEDVALSVLCTVVSTQHEGSATIDGGSKTFATSCAAPAARCASIDAEIDRMNEEHGMLRLGKGVSLKVGDRLALIPYNVSSTVALADELIGVRDGAVEMIWPVAARGCRT